MAKITGEMLRAAMDEELEAEDWGQIDSWWFKPADQATTGEDVMPHYRQENLINLDASPESWPDRPSLSERRNLSHGDVVQLVFEGSFGGRPSVEIYMRADKTDRCAYVARMDDVYISFGPEHVLRIDARRGGGR